MQLRGAEGSYVAGTHGAGGCWGGQPCVTQWGVGGRAGRWVHHQTNCDQLLIQRADTSRPILDRQPIVGQSRTK